MFEQKTFTHKKVVITSDLLSENTESGRYYVLEDGKKLPSVTTVTGWKKNKFFAKWRANNIGFVFQFYNLIPVLTAFENVELPLLLTKLSKAERKEHVETALRLLQERPLGTFRRTLRLPGEVDAEKVDAEVRNGVLSLRIPKAETEKAHQIKVKAK